MSAAGGGPKLQSKLWRPFHRSDFGYHSDLLRKQLWILGDLSSQFQRSRRQKLYLCLFTARPRENCANWLRRWIKAKLPSRQQDVR